MPRSIIQVVGGFDPPPPNPLVRVIGESASLSETHPHELEVAGSSAWLEDDFSTYTSIADFLNDPRGIYDATGQKNTQQMSFVAESPPEVNSTQALRYTFPARTTEVKDFTIRVSPNFPIKTRGDVWYEFWCRFSANFRTGAPNKAYCKVRSVVGTFQNGERITFGGGANVPLRTHRVAQGDMIYRGDATPRPQLDETITGDTSGATAIVDSANYVLVPGPNPDYKMILKRVDSKSGSDTLPTGRFIYLNGNAGSNHMLGHPELADEPSFGGAWQLWDGLWHRFRFRTRCNPAGEPDSVQGTYVAWIDNAELHDFGLIDADRRTYGIHLGANMNVGTDDEITLDWARWRLFDTDPGWGF